MPRPSPQTERVVARYRVGSISTPVFDRSGDVCLAFNVADVPKLMTGAEIERIAKLTRAAADRVTAALGGRPPRRAPAKRRAVLNDGSPA